MLIPEETTTDHRGDILALDQAYENGKVMYYSEEYCRQRHIVVVWDASGDAWCRGIGGLKYRVIKTIKPNPKPFTKFKSGRDR